MIAIETWEPAQFIYTPAQVDAKGHVTAPAQVVDIEVRRFTVSEAGAFDGLWHDAMIGESDRLISVRVESELAQRVTSAVTADELEAAEREAARIASLPPDAAGAAARLAYVALLAKLQPTDAFVVPIEEVRRRRLSDMTPETRAAYERLRDKDRQAQVRLTQDAIANYIRVTPGQMSLDGEEVTTGAQLARAVGSRPDITSQLLAIVRGINLLNDAEKKAWRSRSISRTSSSERDREAPGLLPEAVAARANDTGSAASAAATPTAASLSGGTAP